MRKFLLLQIIVLTSLSFLVAQQETIVYVDSVVIIGNKKTKDRVIRRELEFKVHHEYSQNELRKKLDASTENLKNTSLFTFVDVEVKPSDTSNTRGGHIYIKINLIENWYIYPFPIIELIDRNFNVWWVEQQRSLKRMNIGVEFVHLNLSGNRDKLKLYAKFGYTREFSVEYSLPNFNHSQTLGFAILAQYSLNKELNYATTSNKQDFYKDETQFIRQRGRINFNLSYRPKFRSYHQLNISYHQNKINPYIANELNPDYFLSRRTLQRYFGIRYSYRWDNRNQRVYPTKGNLLNFSVEKNGIGIFSDRNDLAIRGSINQFLEASKVISFGLSAHFKTSLIRSKLPYNDYRALGFGSSNMHGFEYYVVDGSDMVVGKTSIRFLLLTKQVNFGRLMPIKQFKKMAFQAYFTMNSDYGYVNDPFYGIENFLNNRFLWGGGLGLDMLFFYDKTLRIEYNVNHLLENGVFLHLNLNI